MKKYPSFVAAEIDNWVAWSWSGESPEPREPARCYSVEGAYRVRHSNSEEVDPAPPKRIFNTERALRVQAIFDRMSQVTRRVLMYEYIHRTRYDQWERGEEIAGGQLMQAWVRVGNNRRQRARIELGISKGRYHACLDEFCHEVSREFSK